MMPEQLTYEQAYEQHELLIRRYIASHIRNVDIIDDLAQETWLKAWRAWSRVDQAYLRSWLFTIALNTIRDYARREKLAVIVNLDEDHARTLYDNRDELSPIEEQMCLVPLLARLTQETRETVLLRAQGYSLEEIAEFLHVKASGVKMRVTRGREHLGKMWKKEVA
jgi:RNA polymerase sigma-70 factor (ECF subfamily)